MMRKNIDNIVNKYNHKKSDLKKLNVFLRSDFFIMIIAHR